MSSPVLYSPAELVCAAWIASIPGFTADSIAPELPPDDALWKTNGAVTMLVVGGTEDAYAAFYDTVLQVECWTCNPGSNKPSFLESSNMGAQIRLACKDRMGAKRRVQPVPSGFLPDGTPYTGTPYPAVTVHDVTVLSAPRRAYGLKEDYAGNSFDLAFYWVQDDLVTR